MAVSAIPDPHLGRRIRAARILLGLRQTDLARVAGVARSTVVRAEQGLPVTRAVSAQLALALGVDLGTPKATR